MKSSGSRSKFSPMQGCDDKSLLTRDTKMITKQEKAKLTRAFSAEMLRTFGLTSADAGVDDQEILDHCEGLTVKQAVREFGARYGLTQIPRRSAKRKII